MKSTRRLDRGFYLQRKARGFYQMTLRSSAPTVYEVDIRHSETLQVRQHQHFTWGSINTSRGVLPTASEGSINTLSGDRAYSLLGNSESIYASIYASIIYASYAVSRYSRELNETISGISYRQKYFSSYYALRAHQSSLFRIDAWQRLVNERRVGRACDAHPRRWTDDANSANSAKNAKNAKKQWN